MSEWWTYRPSDFLMYSPRAWGRLLEALHAQLWPAQVVVALLALHALTVAWRGTRAVVPAVAGVLALAWAWIAWDFYGTRLAQISTAAVWMGAAAGVQAVLLAACGWRVADGAVRRPLRVAGLSLAAAALLAWPLVAPLRGLGWGQSELPGLTPDATALFTIGLLLALPLRRRAWLLPIPVALLAVGATLQVLLVLR